MAHWPYNTIGSFKETLSRTNTCACLSWARLPPRNRGWARLALPSKVKAVMTTEASLKGCEIKMPKWNQHETTWPQVVSCKTFLGGLWVYSGICSAGFTKDACLEVALSANAMGTCTYNPSRKSPCFNLFPTRFNSSWDLVSTCSNHLSSLASMASPSPLVPQRHRLTHQAGASLRRRAAKNAIPEHGTGLLGNLKSGGAWCHRNPGPIGPQCNLVTKHGCTFIINYNIL